MSDYHFSNLSDYLGKADKLGQEDRYEEAFKILDEAEDLPPDMLGMDGMEEIGKRREDLKKYRNKRAQALQGQILDIMEKPLSDASDEALAVGDESLARLAVVQTDLLAWEELNRRWQGYRQRVAEYRETERVAQCMDEMEEKLRKTWEENSMLSLPEFDRAVVEARRLAMEYPGSDKAQQLLAQAEKERGKAYEMADEPVTQAEQGRYNALIKAMVADKERGIKTIYKYERQEGKLIPTEPVSVDEAIDHLMTLRTQFQNRKIQEYIDKARKSLGEGYLAAALNIIEKAKEKFVYADQGEKQRLDRVIEDEIEPAISRRKLARELALEAQRKARINPEKAWNLLQEARDIDDLSPDILRAQQAILPHLKVHLEGKLQDADEKRHNDELEVAELTIDTVLKYANAAELAEIGARAEALKQKCNEDKLLLKSIMDAAGQIRELLDTDLSAAQQLLQEAQKKIVGRPDYFHQPLNAVEAQIQGRLSVQDILKGMQISFDVLNPADVRGFRYLSDELNETELRKIKNIQRSLEELAQKALEQKHQHEDIARLWGHIRGRLHLIQGRLDWQIGLYKRALQEWQECSKKGVADDRIRADEWIAKAKDATAVDQALEDAKLKTEKTEKQDFEDALNVLEPWLSAPSPRQTEARTLYRTIKLTWIAQLQKEIETDKDEDGRKLRAQDIVDRLDTLQRLDAELARKYADKQVEIYHRWAKKTPSTERKIDYYEKALQVAGDPPPAQIVKELFWVKREQFLDQLEQSSTEQALDRLKNWIAEYKNDVPTRLVLIRRLLKQGDDAQTPIEMAEKHLSEARQKSEPFEAGVDSSSALLEAELKLKAMKIQSQSLIDMNKAKNSISNWLEPDQGVLDYHHAANTLEIQKRALTQKAQVMNSELSQSEDYQSLDAGAQVRVKKEWDAVRSWLNKESQSEGEFHQWFKQTKHALLAMLRGRWEQYAPIPVMDMALKAAKPTSEQMERLRTGLRIRYLSKGDAAGLAALRELGDLHRKLNEEYNKLTKDIKGPEFDLVGGSISPIQSLEKQQEWALTLKKWAQEIDGIYVFYRTTETDDDAGLKAVIDDLDRFYKQLIQLEQKKNQVLSNLDRAKRAGDISFDGHSWQNVPWRQMARELLLSAGTSATIRSLEPGFWQQLDSEDRNTHDAAWEKAADVLYEMRLDNNIGRMPWQKLDKVIRDAKIDERWESVLDPISELTIMTGHRVLKWLQTEVNHTRQTRNRLVLAATFLYALVQAERFQLALEQMALMQQLDDDNDFGFRTGALIKDPVPLTWDALKNKLTEQKQQWEAFQTWWQPVTSSALPVWVNGVDDGSPSGRDRLVAYVKRAQYEDAYQLAVDALYGVDAIPHVLEVYDKKRELPARKRKEEFQEKLMVLENNQTLKGATNALGGGMALAPLLRHLEQQPDMLMTAPSRRMKRAMSEVEQWLHDVKESISEVHYWLDGQIQPQQLHPDLASPIPDLQDKYETTIIQLDDCTKKLSSFWPLFKRNLRDYCQGLLDELEEIAPDGDYDDYESWI